MIDFKELEEKYVKCSHFKRREIIISEMDALAKTGLSCQSCEGFCCTFSYNSMQVTPLEALDTYSFLKNNNMINEELIESLKSCIKAYRLDVEISLGKSGEFRRHYTCPFYNAGPKGCSISRKSKPYGCLGFNALEENVSVEGKCTSNLEVLRKREQVLDEKAINDEVKSILGLYWDKKNYPVAVLNLIEIFKQ